MNFIRKNKDKENENDIYNIPCIYSFYEPNTNKQYQYKEDNILINGINSKNQGFIDMLLTINDKYYINKNQQKNHIINNKLLLNNEIKNNSKINKINNNDRILLFSDLNKCADEDNILEFIKIVEDCNSYNGFIKEIYDGYYLICKSDNFDNDRIKIKDDKSNRPNRKDKFDNNTLKIFDIYFNQVIHVKENISSIFSVCHKSYQDKKGHKIVQLIITAKTELHLILVNLDEKNYKFINKYGIKNIFGFNCFEMNPSNHIIIGKNGVINLLNAFNKSKIKESNIISKKAYFNGLKINDNILAITSNSVYPGGEDILSFCNQKKKKNYKKY